MPTTPPAHTEEALKAGWDQLLHVFTYANATVSEADLYDSPTSMGLDNAYIAELIKWALVGNFMERAEEAGRYRLTSKGVRTWHASRESG